MSNISIEYVQNTSTWALLLLANWQELTELCWHYFTSLLLSAGGRGAWSVQNKNKLDRVFKLGGKITEGPMCSIINMASQHTMNLAHTIIADPLQPLRPPYFDLQGTGSSFPGCGQKAHHILCLMQHSAAQQALITSPAFGTFLILHLMCFIDFP